MVSAAHEYGETSRLVSVLTPSFNQAEWLCDNLRSVACQTYSNIEHIVMDGGSTDGSLEILREAGDSVIWRSEPDRGQSHAINKAFSASGGEIIGWINSDDAYFDCDVVADVVAYFAAHQDVDVVYGHCLQTDSHGHAIQVLWAPPRAEQLLPLVNVLSQPSVFLRRSALAEPMLDVSFHFALDYELWLRLLSQGRRFARIDRILSIDRHQPERKSATIKDVHASDLDRLADKYDTKFPVEWEGDRTLWYVRQRLMGGLLVPRIDPGKLAFSAPADMKRGLLGRQWVTRKSRWPEEYR